MYLLSLKESAVVATNPNFVAIAVFSAVLIVLGTIAFSMFFLEKENSFPKEETYKERFFSSRLLILRITIVSYTLALLAGSLLLVTQPTMNKIEGEVVSIAEPVPGIDKTNHSSQDMTLKSKQGDIEVKLNKSVSPNVISEGENVSLACAEDTKIPIINNAKDAQVRCDVIDE